MHKMHNNKSAKFIIEDCKCYLLNKYIKNTKYVFIKVYLKIKFGLKDLVASGDCSPSTK